MVRIYQNILVIQMTDIMEVVCILLMVYMLFISIIRFSVIHVYIYGQVSSVALKTFSVNIHFPPSCIHHFITFLLKFL